MLQVLAAFVRAGQLHDDRAAAEEALAQARSSWSQLTGQQQVALTALGKRLAGGPQQDDVPLAQALLELQQAAESPQHGLAAVRELWPKLLPASREAITPLSKMLSAPTADEDDLAARYADYAHLTEDDLDEDPGAYFEPTRYASGHDDLTDPSSRQVGIDSDRTPEDLLSSWGLAGFRPGQRDAVQAALDRRDSLIVMPTGGGKSLCYQLPAIASDALTVVVSPLIALIADQHRRLLEAGQRSVMLASSLGDEANRQALDHVRDGWAQVVFCAPERFASRAFRRALERRRIGLFVVDEAHCVSEWGHDFRPDYLRLRPVIEALGRPPIMAATATATPKVADEIVARLGLNDPVVVRRGFDRPNLSFDVVQFAGEGAVARKRATLIAGLSDAANRPAVVYCGTRNHTEQVTETLRGEGISAVCYHAGLGSETRTANQEQFMSSRADVIVATNAFGLGVDFPFGVRSVWHWALPTSVEAYYQEAGRAGRDGQPARAVLLAMRGDLGRLIQFIKNGELQVDDVRRCLNRLTRQAVDNVATIDPRDQDDRDRIALAVAERSGAVSIAPAGAGRIAVRMDAPLDERATHRVCKEAVNRRWDAYQALKQFASSNICRRRQLLDHFGDDEPGRPEGRCCDVCSPTDWLTVPDVKPGRARRAKAAAPATTASPVDEAQMAALKAWRAERADGKPAYTVANNATLEEVLRRRPMSSDQLIDIKGIGPSFISKHGDSLLAELARI